LKGRSNLTGPFSLQNSFHADVAQGCAMQCSSQAGLVWVVPTGTGAVSGSGR